MADITQDVVAELRSMGYSQISVERTLLGRVKIEAEGSEGSREIIVNPRTGEILRDLFIRASGGNSGRLLRDDSRDDDDGDRDDDRDDDRDNSGSGSDDRDEDRDDSDDRDNSGSGSDDSDDGGGDDD
jgi:hypothetical protein